MAESLTCSNLHSRLTLSKKMIMITMMMEMKMITKETVTAPRCSLKLQKIRCFLSKRVTMRKITLLVVYLIPTQSLVKNKLLTTKYPPNSVRAT